MRAMTAILYPVAETADQALHAPKGFAVREREAVAAAGGAVEFVTEAVGPAFVSEAAALEAYADSQHAPGGWRTLRPVADGPAPKPARPVNADGRRWAEPERRPSTHWRLSVSYWRIVSADRALELQGPARKLRKDPAAAEKLDARQLRALAHQPLRAAEPQRALDIGLFEVRLPEAPDRIVPDE